jgi:hypothetical protein
MGVLTHEVAPALLLGVFLFVLFASVSLVLIIIKIRKLKNLSLAAELSCNERESSRVKHFLPNAGWKRPGCWLAINNRNLRAVQSALSLHNPKPCSWAEGLSGEGGQKLFISPPVDGWVLVMGAALPDANDDVDACYRFLTDLSRKLGHVQFFQANSVVDHHAWARLESGRVVRAYAWAGTTLWNQGEKTAAEGELRMKCRDYAEPPDPLTFDTPKGAATNSEKVHLLAASWSVDPDEIDEQSLEREWGIVGEPTRHF